MIYIIVLYLFLTVLQGLIFVRVLLSWIPINRDNPIIGFIRQVTDPLLLPAKSIINKSIFGGKGSVLDFSPLIVLLIIGAIKAPLAGFIG